MQKQHQNEITITIDPVKLVAVKGEQVFDLALTELRVLAVFLQNKGKVLDRSTIYANMGTAAKDTFSNIVDVYVNYLRQKLGKDLITTVRGQGYIYTGLQEVAA